MRSSFGEKERNVAFAEKRQVVKPAFDTDARLALVTRAHGRNTNHVLKWRRAFERSELVDSAVAFTALLSVTAAAPGEAEIRQLAAQQQPAFGPIHIEFPGSAMIGVGCDAETTDNQQKGFQSGQMAR